MLLPAKENSIIQEKSSERYVFVALSSCCFKMVLVLQAEMVAFYMRVSIVCIWIPNLKRFIWSIFLLLSWRRGKSMIPDTLHVCLHELFEHFFGSKQSGIRSCGSQRRTRYGEARCGWACFEWSDRSGRVSLKDLVTWWGYSEQSRERRRDEAERNSMPSKRAGWTFGEAFRIVKRGQLVTY